MLLWNSWLPASTFSFATACLWTVDFIWLTRASSLYALLGYLTHPTLVLCFVQTAQVMPRSVWRSQEWVLSHTGSNPLALCPPVFSFDFLKKNTILVHLIPFHCQQLSLRSGARLPACCPAATPSSSLISSPSPPCTWACTWACTWTCLWASPDPPGLALLQCYEREREKLGL